MVLSIDVLHVILPCLDASSLELASHLFDVLQHACALAQRLGHERNNAVLVVDAHALQRREG